MRTKSKCKFKYYIPGGKREKGESDEQTLVREVSEELTVNIIPDTIEYVGTFRAQSDGAKDGVLVKMTCYKALFNETFHPNMEIEEIRRLDSNDTYRISEVYKLIFRHLVSTVELN
ncbi:NUDIX hydrolase [Maribacter sp. IgM3_T14_3]|uniref:NUDIX hydrolase n=1 Tax=Maribacter sp. IgM3_T14_3 TaxID=3415140 RepID=UPI003C6EEE2C